MAHPLLSMQSNTSTVSAAEATLIDQMPVLMPDALIGVNGTVRTTGQVVTQLKDHLATLHKIEALRAELSQLVEQQKAERAAVRVTVAAVESYVVNYLGAASPVFGMLGFVARKRTAPSAEVTAAAVAKRLATRKKRFILGKRQRAAIPPATPAEATSAAAAGPPRRYARAARSSSVRIFAVSAAGSNGFDRNSSPSTPTSASASSVYPDM